MRYRVQRKDECLVEDRWVRAWTVQVWTGTDWVDVTRPYESELEAKGVLDVLKK